MLVRVDDGEMVELAVGDVVVSWLIQPHMKTKSISKAIPSFLMALTVKYENRLIYNTSVKQFC